MRLSAQTRDNLTSFALIITVAAAAAVTPANNLRFVLGLVAVMMTVILVFVLSVTKRVMAQNEELRERERIPAAVDPWAMQDELMRISDQQRPQFPALTKASLMYSALILEEGSELFRDGVVPTLDRLIAHATTWQKPAGHVLPLKVIRGKLQESAVIMDENSRMIRAYLKEVPEFVFPMVRAEAVPTFDGTTDLAVVNCGFCIASGMDGSAGYLEVGGSNLSKKNPESGLIEKTPDGKWIKGSQYRAPDLEEVLRETASQRGLQGLAGA